MPRIVLAVFPAILLASCASPPSGSDGGSVEAGLADTGADCTGRPVEAPSPRGEITGILDEARNRIVVFGGNVRAPERCMPRYEMVAEVWAYHLDCDSWEPIAATGPTPRARAASTLDTRRGRMLVFGGRDRAPGGSGFVNFADVWALDLATDSWTEVSAGGGPAPRSSAAVAYDPSRDRLLVFGGNTSTSGLMLTGTDDLWELDLASGSWREIASAERPGPRFYHSGVVIGNEWIVFGGARAFDPPYWNDTWAFDMTTDTWRRIDDGSAPGAPAPRFGHEVYAWGGRLFVIGGHDEASAAGRDVGNRNDVWALDLATRTWTQVRPGDTPNGMSSGFCDFPADFTIPEEGSPERRYAFARAQDATRAYVIGGKTDCGNVNDVWALHFGSGTWSLLRPTTGGEACNRSGRVGCTTLCY
jgi:N-acetylneuraminic acid mutarotase